MIELRNIEFGYGKAALFNDLSLGLNPGCIYGLLGRNGVGKTTLLKLILGLRFPKRGSIHVLGWEPHRREPQFLAEVCIIPEIFHAPAISAVKYAHRYGAFYPRFNHAEFQGLLREFEIEDRKPLSILSYGQKKKALLAFALATNCRLLVLDEPTNGLDIPAKSQFRRVLAGALTEDRTFIISTHQVRDMGNLIDPIVILHDGRIVLNHSLAAISTKLVAEVTAELPRPEDVLFSEPALGGYSVVRANTHGEDCPVDLETLFNAVTAVPDKVRAVLEQGESHAST